MSERLIASEMSRGFKSYRGVIDTALGGYGPQGAMVDRSLFEGMAVAHWVKLNPELAEDEQDSEIPPIPVELSPHSLRRTFASLLYLRGENPVYVMQQMGHTDPKLALRIYTKVIGDQRRRGPGARLVGVLDGARWTGADNHAEPTVDAHAQAAVR